MEEPSAAITVLDVAFFAVSFSQPVRVLVGAEDALTVVPTVPLPFSELS